VHVFLLILQGYKDSVLFKTDLESSKENLIQYYYFLKDKMKIDSVEHDYENHDLMYLIECLGVFDHDVRINAIFSELLINNKIENSFTFSKNGYRTKSKPNLSLNIYICEAMIKNSQNVDSLILYHIADDILNHNYFYKFLKDQNKLELYPEKLKTQFYFALSDIGQNCTEEEDNPIPEGIDFIEKRIISQGKNKGVYYFFNRRYALTSKNSICLMVSGPQPLNQNEFVLYANKTQDLGLGNINPQLLKSEIDKIILKFMNEK